MASMASGKQKTCEFAQEDVPEHTGSAVNISGCELVYSLCSGLINVLQVTEVEIARYAQEEKHSTGRTDFLAQLKMKEAKMSEHDLLNHLSNNMYDFQGQSYLQFH